MERNGLGGQHELPAQAPPVVQAGDEVFDFGPYRLLVGRRLLLDAGRPVHVGDRALDLLVGLVRRAGEVLSKETLLKLAWPTTTVEESNLRVHVAALRKVLGDGRSGQRYIVNVAGRGYSFVAPVQPAADPAPAARPTSGLPLTLNRVIGRDTVVGELADKLAVHRFVTIVGPGGIGKTTTGVAVAQRLDDAYPDGVVFADLAPVADPDLVPQAVAAALGMPLASGDPSARLVAALNQRRSLILLDSCEHVVEAAAVLAEALLRGAADVSILATSREPLRAEGEWVHRLAPLEAPPAGASATAEAALRYPAIQLFVERAMASAGGFELNDESAGTVVDICRRLDGIPLALELGAGMVEPFGIHGLAHHLRDRFVLLAKGRRTALPRHQTLKATLDWSYELLSDTERMVLRRLAVFAGRFEMESAQAVAADAAIDEPAIAACVAALVAKSLVAARLVNGTVVHRLLDVTRAYALDQLVESGEYKRLAQRHAEHHRDVFAQAEPDALSKAGWLARYASRIDDLRVALDWAFSAGAARPVGVPLTIAAGPVWASLLLFDEWHRRVEQALSCLDPSAADDRRERMQLYSALAAVRLHIDGAGPALDDAWMNALVLAEQLDDSEHALPALWGLMLSATQRNCREALSYAERFRAVSASSNDTAAQAIGSRLIGFMLHMLGDQTNARPPVERMLTSHPRRSEPRHLLRYGFDQPIIGRSVLALILWLQGLPDQALAAARSVTSEALDVGHDASLLYVLTRTTGPIAVVAGDLEMAEAAVALLRDRFSRHGPYDLWRRAFEGAVMVRQGAAAAGAALLQSAMAAAPEHSFAARFSLFATELADALGRDGRHDEALQVVQEALRRARRIEELWWEAELVRVCGEIELLRGAADAAATHFGEAGTIASRQGALSLELRAATSLARLRHQQGRTVEALAQLAPVYARFAEGFATSDLVAAKALLAQLRQAHNQN